MVDLVPNELQDFLVLQPVFEQRLRWFVDYRQSDQALKPVKVLTKKGIKQVTITKDFDPVEPTLFSNSLWKNIRCVEAFGGRGGRSVYEMPAHRQSARIAGQTDDEIRINFWEIQFPPELTKRETLERTLSTFNGD